jgi:mycothiol synthase
MTAVNFRPPVPEDAPAVLGLIVACDIADLGVPDYTLEDLHDDWRRSDFDLTADARVVEAGDGRIVGYAAAIRPGTLAVVASDHERRGVGTRLLEFVEQRDRDRHRQGIPAANTRAQALLLAAGYSPERSYWRMTLQLDNLAVAGLPPIDVTVRPVDLEPDAAAVHALNEISFAANADYRPEPFDTFCEEHLRAHDLSPGSAAWPSEATWPSAFFWRGDGRKRASAS